MPLTVRNLAVERLSNEPARTNRSSIWVDFPKPLAASIEFLSNDCQKTVFTVPYQIDDLAREISYTRSDVPVAVLCRCIRFKYMDETFGVTHIYLSFGAKRDASRLVEAGYGVPNAR